MLIRIFFFILFCSDVILNSFAIAMEEKVWNDHYPSEAQVEAILQDMIRKDVLSLHRFHKDREHSEKYTLSADGNCWRLADIWLRNEDKEKDPTSIFVKFVGLINDSLEYRIYFGQKDNISHPHFFSYCLFTKSPTMKRDDPSYITEKQAKRILLTSPSLSPAELAGKAALSADQTLWIIDKISVHEKDKKKLFTPKVSVTLRCRLSNAADRELLDKVIFCIDWEKPVQEKNPLYYEANSQRGNQISYCIFWTDKKNDQIGQIAPKTPPNWPLYYPSVQRVGELVQDMIWKKALPIAGRSTEIYTLSDDGGCWQLGEVLIDKIDEGKDPSSIFVEVDEACCPSYQKVAYTIYFGKKAWPAFSTCCFTKAPNMNRDDPSYISSMQAKEVLLTSPALLHSDLAKITIESEDKTPWALCFLRVHENDKGKAFTSKTSVTLCNRISANMSSSDSLTFCIAWAQPVQEEKPLFPYWEVERKDYEEISYCTFHRVHPKEKEQNRQIKARPIEDKETVQKTRHSKKDMRRVISEFDNYPDGKNNTGKKHIFDIPQREAFKVSYIHQRDNNDYLLNWIRQFPSLAPTGTERATNPSYTICEALWDSESQNTWTFSGTNGIADDAKAATIKGLMFIEKDYRGHAIYQVFFAENPSKPATGLQTIALACGKNGKHLQEQRLNKKSEHQPSGQILQAQNQPAKQEEDKLEVADKTECLLKWIRQLPSLAPGTERATNPVYTICEDLWEEGSEDIWTFFCSSGIPKNTDAATIKGLKFIDKNERGHDVYEVIFSKNPAEPPTAMKTITLAFRKNGKRHYDQRLEAQKEREKQERREQEEIDRKQKEKAKIDCLLVWVKQFPTLTPTEDELAKNPAYTICEDNWDNFSKNTWTILSSSGFTDKTKAAAIKDLKFLHKKDMGREVYQIIFSGDPLEQACALQTITLSVCNNGKQQQEQRIKEYKLQEQMEREQKLQAQKPEGQKLDDTNAVQPQKQTRSKRPVAAKKEEVKTKAQCLLDWVQKLPSLRSPTKIDRTKPEYTIAEKIWDSRSSQQWTFLCSSGIAGQAKAADIRALVPIAGNSPGIEVYNVIFENASSQTKTQQTITLKKL